MSRFERPQRLNSTFVVAEFDCGVPALNIWLQRFAFTNQQAGMAVTYAVTDGGEPPTVVGFYSLSTGSVEPTLAPPRMVKGVARHAVPVIVLSRLAVDLRYQNRSIGAGLLQDALYRVAVVAEEIGVRALLIHAKDEASHNFYMQQAEFERSPVDDLQLFLLIKDLRVALES